MNKKLFIIIITSLLVLTGLFYLRKNASPQVGGESIVVMAREEDKDLMDGLVETKALYDQEHKVFDGKGLRVNITREALDQVFGQAGDLEEEAINFIEVLMNKIDIDSKYEEDYKSAVRDSMLEYGIEDEEKIKLMEESIEIYR